MTFGLNNKMVGINMKKLLLIVTLAGMTTFGLFSFMAFLINNDEVGITDPEPPVIVEVFQLPEDSKIEIITRKVLTPPVAKPPMQRDMTQPEVVDSGTDFGYNPTGLKVVTQQTSFGSINKPTNTEARPIVRIAPKYPLTAVRDGTEGWVILGFDISAIGGVVNIKILDSQPKRVFDKAAKQALRKWKYQAKSENGKAIIQKGFSVQLDFKMDQST